MWGGNFKFCAKKPTNSSDSPGTLPVCWFLHTSVIYTVIMTNFSIVCNPHIFEEFICSLFPSRCHVLKSNRTDAIKYYSRVPQHYSRVDEISPVGRPPPLSRLWVAEPVADFADRTREAAGNKVPGEKNGKNAVFKKKSRSGSLLSRWKLFFPFSL